MTNARGARPFATASEFVGSGVARDGGPTSTAARHPAIEECVVCGDESLDGTKLLFESDALRTQWHKIVAFIARGNAPSGDFIERFGGPMMKGVRACAGRTGDPLADAAAAPIACDLAEVARCADGPFEAVHSHPRYEARSATVYRVVLVASAMTAPPDFPEFPFPGGPSPAPVNSQAAAPRGVARGDATPLPTDRWLQEIAGSPSVRGNTGGAGEPLLLVELRTLHEPSLHVTFGYVQDAQFRARPLDGIGSDPELAHVPDFLTLLEALAPFAAAKKKSADRAVALPPAVAGRLLPAFVATGKTAFRAVGGRATALTEVLVDGRVARGPEAEARRLWVQDARTGNQSPSVRVVLRGKEPELLPTDPPLYYAPTETGGILGVVSVGVGDDFRTWLRGPSLPPEEVAPFAERLAALRPDLPLPVVPRVEATTTNARLELRFGLLESGADQKRIAQANALARKLGTNFGSRSSPRVVRPYVLWSDGERYFVDGAPRKDLRTVRSGVLHIQKFVDPGIAIARAALKACGFERSPFEGGAYGLVDEAAWYHFLTDATERNALAAAGWNIVYDASFVPPVARKAAIVVSLRPTDESGKWFAPQVQVVVEHGAAGAAADPQALLAALRAAYRAARAGRPPRDPRDAIPVTLRSGPILAFDGPAVALLFSTMTELLDDDTSEAEKALARQRAAEEYLLTDDGSVALLTNHIALNSVRAALLADAFGITASPLTALRKRLSELSQEEVLPAVPALQATLRDYQCFGQSWLRRRIDAGFGAILADGMGLGKTVQTIAALLARLAPTSVRGGSDRRTMLVVCPTSVVPVWTAELARFAPSLAVVDHTGADRRDRPLQQGHADVVVTSYAILVRDQELLQQTSWDTVVFDEAQFLKNPKTKVREAASELVAHAKVALTGTPVENHLGELWSLVDLVCPGLLGEAFAFQRVFRAPIETGTDPSRLFALRARIAPLVLRRAKDQVLRELPPKTEVDVPVALGISQRALYEGVRLSMEARVRKTLEDHGIGGSSLVLFDALLKLRQCCCDPSLLRAAIPAAADVTESAKREAIVSDVVALVAEGRSIVLFSQFVGYLDLLAADLSASEIPFVRLQGDTKDRASPVAAFQRGDVPVILVSLRAGGTGLTLTAADTVIHADPWWNPAVEDQATDRAHRIGQERPLLVRRYLVRDSIEEKLVALQHRKRGLAALALEATTSDGPEAGGRGELSMFDVDELLALFAR